MNECIEYIYLISLFSFLYGTIPTPMNYNVFYKTSAKIRATKGERRSHFHVVSKIDGSIQSLLEIDVCFTTLLVVIFRRKRPPSRRFCGCGIARRESKRLPCSRLTKVSHSRSVEHGQGCGTYRRVQRQSNGPSKEFFNGMPYAIPTMWYLCCWCCRR